MPPSGDRQRRVGPARGGEPRARINNRFLNDPAYRYLFTLDGTDDEDEPDSANDSNSDVVGQPIRKRKRLTKNEKLINVHQSAIRPINRPPPRLTKTSRELRDLGVEGVANLEKDKMNPLREGRLYEPNYEPHSRYIPRTDLSSYRPTITPIGVDVGDDGADEYAQHPLRWVNQDPALKTAQAIHAAEQRACAKSEKDVDAGRNAPVHFEGHSYVNMDLDFVSTWLNGQTENPSGGCQGSIDALFEDGEGGIEHIDEAQHEVLESDAREMTYGERAALQGLAHGDISPSISGDVKPEYNWLCDLPPVDKPKKVHSQQTAVAQATVKQESPEADIQFVSTRVLEESDMFPLISLDPQSGNTGRVAKLDWAQVRQLAVKLRDRHRYDCLDAEGFLNEARVDSTDQLPSSGNNAIEDKSSLFVPQIFDAGARDALVEHRRAQDLLADTRAGMYELRKLGILQRPKEVPAANSFLAVEGEDKPEEESEASPTVHIEVEPDAEEDTSQDMIGQITSEPACVLNETSLEQDHEESVVQDSSELNKSLSLALSQTDQRWQSSKANPLALRPAKRPSRVDQSIDSPRRRSPDRGWQSRDHHDQNKKQCYERGRDRRSGNVYQREPVSPQHREEGGQVSRGVRQPWVRQPLQQPLPAWKRPPRPKVISESRADWETSEWMMSLEDVDSVKAQFGG